MKSNAAMDFLSSTRSDPVYHFDSEHIDSATLMLRQFWAQTLLSVRAKEYQSARHSLGQLFHSLQVHRLYIVILVRKELKTIEHVCWYIISTRTHTGHACGSSFSLSLSFCFHVSGVKG